MRTRVQWLLDTSHSLLLPPSVPQFESKHVLFPFTLDFDVPMLVLGGRLFGKLIIYQLGSDLDVLFDKQIFSFVYLETSFFLVRFGIFRYICFLIKQNFSTKHQILVTLSAADLLLGLPNNSSKVL